MQKQRITLLLGSLELNSGQLGWLPRNPRQWTRQDVDRMVASLNEDPDFMEDRPPLVVANTEKAGKYVVFGGNMRITAEKERKAAKAVNCILYVPETEDDKTTILRRAMKDNGSFGAWDMDILANEWDGLPLVNWGVPAWDTSASDAAEGDIPADLDADETAKPFVLKITFPSPAKMTAFVMAYKQMIESEYGAIMSQSGGGL